MKREKLESYLNKYVWLSLKGDPNRYYCGYLEESKPSNNSGRTFKVKHYTVLGSHVHFTLSSVCKIK